MYIDAAGLDYIELNKQVRDASEDICISNCLGQRFIASGLRDKNILIEGTPGNTLGAYLDGANITVMGNAQDATGDTMNEGRIVIHGNVGDTAGYAMRGGEIFVRDNAGYRTGIHMKAYADKLPVMVIGGSCGSFLGEYQAGGLIIVLGRNIKEPIVGNFCGTGMHGGRIFLRTDDLNFRLPKQVKVSDASPEDMAHVEKYIRQYAEYFHADAEELLSSHYFVLTPNSANPYKQLYVQN